MNAYGAVNVQIPIFLTSALVGGVVIFTARPLYPRERTPVPTG
jgi:hypothetical protein